MGTMSRYMSPVFSFWVHFTLYPQPPYEMVITTSILLFTRHLIVKWRPTRSPVDELSESSMEGRFKETSYSKHISVKIQALRSSYSHPSATKGNLHTIHSTKSWSTSQSPSDLFQLSTLVQPCGAHPSTPCPNDPNTVTHSVRQHCVQLSYSTFMHATTTISHPPSVSTRDPEYILRTIHFLKRFAILPHIHSTNILITKAPRNSYPYSP